MKRRRTLGSIYVFSLWKTRMQAKRYSTSWVLCFPMLSFSLPLTYLVIGIYFHYNHRCNLVTKYPWLGWGVSRGLFVQTPRALLYLTPFLHFQTPTSFALITSQLRHHASLAIDALPRKERYPYVVVLIRSGVSDKKGRADIVCVGKSKSMFVILFLVSGLDDKVHYTKFLQNTIS